MEPEHHETLAPSSFNALQHCAHYPPSGAESPSSARGTRIHETTAEMLRKWKATQVPKVLGDWRKPRHEAFEPRTAWSLFNCFTEIMKGLLIFNLAPRTQALHGLLDQLTGVKFSEN